MTVKYDCIINLAELAELGVTKNKLKAAKAAIEKAGYDWYQDKTEIEICGEIGVDDYSTSADDVQWEIKHILWEISEIDADVDVEVDEDDDADWDQIYGF